jgi:hypothetical protein
MLVDGMTRMPKVIETIKHFQKTIIVPEPLGFTWGAMAEVMQWDFTSVFYCRPRSNMEWRFLYFDSEILQDTKALTDRLSSRVTMFRLALRSYCNMHRWMPHYRILSQ